MIDAVRKADPQKQRNSISVMLASGISEALGYMAEGRIEKARVTLEHALLLADVTSPTISERVGLGAVRKGKGFEV